MATPKLEHYFENDLVIPQEILDLVAGNLGDDEASLSALSLASRTFLSASRLHRFRHLTFSNPSPADRLYAYERCLALRKLITQTPDLVRCIRSLTLMLERPLDNDPNIPWIIEHLSSLSSLQLLSGSLEPVAEWDSFCPELQHALQILLRRSTTLRSLVIKSYHDVPRELFRGAVSLKHISLQSISWAAEPLASPYPASATLARPTSLILAHAGGTELYVEPSKRLFWLEDLVELDLAWTEEMGQQFERIFQPCLRSLQVLNVEFSCFLNKSAPVNLSRLPSLRVWKARVHCYKFTLLRRFSTEDDGTDSDEFDIMLDSLRTIEPASSKLESLHFEIQGVDAVDEIRWGELDEIVTRLNALHAIQQVTLDFHCSEAAMDPSGSGTEALIRGHLPLLDALGVLRVEEQIDDSNEMLGW